ncbi:DUF4342 domain-containing protein [Clostridium algidicarnis]|uniref:DUF4342 domain-containing protein n=1 Tax=Clostridium algidicarnis TaxID=37659 RepID=UPI0016296168|nr:DUF4342 domain-containing protein [Clostridium algidicarnis]MBB6630511.1 DUF4342 domain-containing protein [Clostridium algidicarnis]MBB6696352.1 DUF4342 domain-containing protein [Clostridium algidicarnis]MBU3193571.1 DUF4342 domain-containing protein [Clostridium algidicarnis]MBU3205678.1 DUF4342 domain-containing protein [Clostridium algidicarnis]MCB2286483.1 DUF4342 domain-containing protein [Clostridium algidicarnis]
MEDITLEKIDIIRERAGVTYARAKEVLEINEGNIVDSLIYIESNLEDKEKKIYSTLDELIKWLKDIVNKGNVNRIRIKKEDRVLVDVPINAGIAVGVIAAVWKPLIAIGLATATLTTVTVEITKDDGTIEVVNKIIKSKTSNFTKDVKGKIDGITNVVKDKFKKEKSKDEIKINDEPVYKYTVKFEDIDKE